MTELSLPSISIISVNLNAGNILKECLVSVRKQDYPKEKLEHLIVDGGSTDNSKDIAKEFGCIFIEGGYKENQEARRGVGLRNAKNEILIYVDTDNILPSPDWLKRTVEPLMENPNIFGAQSMHYHYDATDTLYNRYCALFGINDPVAMYLKKADRLTYYQKEWYQTQILEDNERYTTIKLNSTNLPTVGCNGFAIRKSILEKADTEGEDFFHIDVIADLVNRSHNQLAIVKNTTWHKTGTTFPELIRKRVLYFGLHAVKLYSKRRYHVFDGKNKKDLMNLAIFCFASLTIIIPLYQSIRGFIKKPDRAWLMHPLTCLLFLLAYTIATIKSFKQKNATSQQ